jgi:hypothetical protein
METRLYSTQYCDLPSKEIKQQQYFEQMYQIILSTIHHNIPLLHNMADAFQFYSAITSAYPIAQSTCQSHSELLITGICNNKHYKYGG